MLANTAFTLLIPFTFASRYFYDERWPSKHDLLGRIYFISYKKEMIISFCPVGYTT